MRPIRPFRPLMCTDEHPRVRSLALPYLGRTSPLVIVPVQDRLDASGRPVVSVTVTYTTE